MNAKRSAFLLILLALITYAGTRTRTNDARTGAGDAAGPARERSLGWVAYIRQGDLWVQALPAGPARRLSRGGKASSPSWSHSGRWLLFRQGDAWWVIQADGSAARRLTEGGSVDSAAWAPQEDRIAYRDGQGEIRTIRADGSEERQVLAPAKGEQVGRIAWSPDGRWIAYELSRRASPPQESYAGLWRASADGGITEELYALRGQAPQCLSLAGWVPDGQSLLFWPHPMCSASLAADGLALMKQSSGGGAPLTLVTGMLTHPDFLALSSAGRLAVVAGAGRETWTEKRIEIIELVSGQIRSLSPEGVAAISPAWSPDGNRLAYAAMPDIGSVGGGEPAKDGLMGRKIWVVQADGTGRSQLTADPHFRDESPRWAGDNHHLLFVRLDKDGRASLWLTDSRDPHPRRVADLGTIESFGYYGWVRTAALYDYWSGQRR